VKPLRFDKLNELRRGEVDAFAQSDCNDVFLEGKEIGNWGFGKNAIAAFLFNKYSNFYWLISQLLTQSCNCRD
jgi:hypothetical protein